MTQSIESILNMTLPKKETRVYNTLKKHFPELTKGNASYIAQNDGAMTIIFSGKIKKSTKKFPGDPKENLLSNNAYKDEAAKYLAQWFNIPNTVWSAKIINIMCKYCRDKSSEKL